MFYFLFIILLQENPHHQLTTTYQEEAHLIVPYVIENVNISIIWKVTYPCIFGKKSRNRSQVGAAGLANQATFVKFAITWPLLWTHWPLMLGTCIHCFMDIWAKRCKKNIKKLRTSLVNLWGMSLKIFFTLYYCSVHYENIAESKIPPMPKLTHQMSYKMANSDLMNSLIWMHLKHKVISRKMINWIKNLTR